MEFYNPQIIFNVSLSSTVSYKLLRTETFIKSRNILMPFFPTSKATKQLSCSSWAAVVLGLCSAPMGCAVSVGQGRGTAPGWEVIEICTAGILLLGRQGWAKLPGLAAPQLSSRGSCCNELPGVLACVEELAKGSMVVGDLLAHREQMSFVGLISGIWAALWAKFQARPCHTHVPVLFLWTGNLI